MNPITRFAFAVDRLIEHFLQALHSNIITYTNPIPIRSSTPPTVAKRQSRHYPPANRSC